MVPPLESGYQPVYVMRRGRKGSYEPNKGAVDNIGEFLKQYDFGKQLEEGSQKTNRFIQCQAIYKASRDIGKNISKRDQFCLDGQHKNHLEVFDRKNKFLSVLNLDGSVNDDKTNRAKKAGRTLPKCRKK